MDVKHGPSPRHLQNVWMLSSSTPGACGVRKILCIPYTRHTTNNTVRNIIACSPVLGGQVRLLWLSIFGHLARTAPKEDHHCVITAALRPPADYRRSVGHLRTIWLRAIDDNLQSLNFGIHTAWRKARDRDVWHQVVSGVCNTTLSPLSTDGR